MSMSPPREASREFLTADLDALIERLNSRSCELTPECDEHKDIRAAAAALVQLRDSEALARGKIAEQMIEIARLQDDTAEIDRLRGENARMFPAGYELYRTSEISRIAALEAERDIAALEAERDQMRAQVEYWRDIAAQLRRAE